MVKEMEWERQLGAEKYQELCREREERERKAWEEQEGREAPIRKLLDVMQILADFRPELATEVIVQTVPSLSEKALGKVRQAVQKRQKQLDRERSQRKAGKPRAEETPGTLHEWMQVAWWRLVDRKTLREIARQKGMPWQGAEEVKRSTTILNRQVKDLAGLVRAELVRYGADGEGKNLGRHLGRDSVRDLLRWRFGLPVCRVHGWQDKGIMRKHERINRHLAQMLYFPGSQLPPTEKIVRDAKDLTKKLFPMGKKHTPTLKKLRELLRSSSPVSTP